MGVPPVFILCFGIFHETHHLCSDELLYMRMSRGHCYITIRINGIVMILTKMGPIQFASGMILRWVYIAVVNP